MSQDLWQGIAPVGAVGRPGALTDGLRVGDAAPAATGQFGKLVADGLGAVNEQLLTSQVDLQRLATGDAQNLHQIMIRLEESRLSFHLLLQVRNRLLEAYDTVMKMQV